MENVKMKIKFVTKLISAVCAATMAISVVAMPVGALGNQQLQAQAISAKIEEFNIKIEKLEKEKIDYIRVYKGMIQPLCADQEKLRNIIIECAPDKKTADQIIELTEKVVELTEKVVELTEKGVELTEKKGEIEKKWNDFWKQFKTEKTKLKKYLVKLSEKYKQILEIKSCVEKSYQKYLEILNNKLKKVEDEKNVLTKQLELLLNDKSSNNDDKSNIEKPNENTDKSNIEKPNENTDKSKKLKDEIEKEISNLESKHLSLVKKKVRKKI